MYCQTILMINLDPSTCQQIRSILQRNLMVSYAVQTLQWLSSEGNHWTIPKCEIIIARKTRPDDPIIRWLMSEDQCKRRPKLIVIDSVVDYTFVRRALQYGLLDYWILPLSNAMILEALGLCSVAKERHSYAGLDYQLARMLMGKQGVDEQCLTEFYVILRGHHERIRDAESRIIRGWRMILEHISFEPMGIERSTLARMIGKWMVEQSDAYDTFRCAFFYAKNVYSDLFCPHIRSSISRQTIYEVLDPSFRDKSVRHLAQRLYLNQSYLSISFKGEVGIPLSTYIRRVKLYGSMILLLDHQTSLDHVLNILEYKDSKYFAKLFKKHTGLTPDRFKRLYHAIYRHREQRTFLID